MKSSTEKEVLGIIVPATDLVYRNGFALLIQDVTFVLVVGQTGMKKTDVTIGAGRILKHLAILFKKHPPLGMPPRRQQAIPGEKVK